MVSTSTSVRYTVEALKSFAACTRLRSDDRFFLIDNDASLGDGLPLVPHAETITNDVPRGFATNVNGILARARDVRADLFFLNNDLIFTRGWLEPLTTDMPAILSPLSNAEVSYSSGRLTCGFTMDLEDYLGRERELASIADKHRRKHARGFLSFFSVPFFCVKLPYSVYSTVGDLDETFGPGGGEDKDYCVRAILAGFSVQYSLGSWVVHFQGRSTWRGAETQEQTAKRDETFVTTFRAKWGDALTKLFIYQDEKVVTEAGLDEVKQQGRLADIVRHLQGR